MQKGLADCSSSSSSNNNNGRSNSVRAKSLIGGSLC